METVMRIRQKNIIIFTLIFNKVLRFLTSN